MVSSTASKFTKEKKGHTNKPDIGNIRYFVGWLNDAAVRFGGRQVCLLYLMSEGDSNTHLDAY
jgi:hypothetical protein